MLLYFTRFVLSGTKTNDAWMSTVLTSWLIMYVRHILRVYPDNKEVFLFFAILHDVTAASM